MDTRQLNQFLLLAETLHFGRASEAAHVSASALSRAIRQLERELGVQLFDRDRRRVELTAEGQRLRDWARETLASLGDLRDTLHRESGSLRGEVSLYCSVTASYSFLYELLARLRRDHPGIDIKLHTGDPEDAVARVMSGSEDIAIGARPRRLPAGLAFHAITRSPLVFIERTTDAGRPPAPSTSSPRRPIRWGEVPMILPERGLARQRVEAWFRARGETPRVYAQVAGNEAIVSMVSLGLGVGVVPRIVLDNSPLADQVRVLPVRPALEPYEVGLFTLRRRLKTPLIAAFWTPQVGRSRTD
ncbi:MAG: HTH-type transcriptional activator IlvY [Gammaproteobacteria bacterium]|nr:HTH-type transcriptional activator IlvY [Gammaproteobacteria bacterium]TVQ45263.1 MAG: HTH-type transcriptional activator IlvY [Gammaproteobacteria bacterium]